MIMSLKLAAGAFVVGAALVTAAIWYGYQWGNDAARLDALRRSVELLRERSESDAPIAGMSDVALCVELGGLPDDCAGI